MKTHRIVAESEVDPVDIEAWGRGLVWSTIGITVRVECAATDKAISQAKWELDRHAAEVHRQLDAARPAPVGPVLVAGDDAQDHLTRKDSNTNGNKYRKKPVEVEARKLTHDNATEVAAWCGASPGWEKFTDSGEEITTTEPFMGFQLPTLEGVMNASPGDWIIRGVQGEFYPCKPDIFADTYEPVEETT